MDERHEIFYVKMISNFGCRKLVEPSTSFVRDSGWALKYLFTSFLMINRVIRRAS